VHILADRLNHEQVQKLLSIDAKYLGYNALNGTADPDRTPYVPGGLSTIVELAGFVEKELMIGTLDRTRKALDELVVPDLLRRPGLGGGLSDPYWDLAGGESGERWRSALDLYADLEARETSFWEHFRHRLAESLGAEIPRIVAIPVKPKHRRVMQPLLEDQCRVIARGIEDGSLSPSAILSRSVKRPPKDFPRLDDLRWAEVSFDFISQDSVKISARGISKVFGFAEMGFADGRKVKTPNGQREFADGRRVNTPDGQWKLLQYIARHGGELKWSDKVDARVRGGAKAKIKTIRVRLKAVLHIDDDPFVPYRKVKAYKPKFTIVDSSSSPHRAEDHSPATTDAD
jgi:hypothetical protein